MTKKARSIYIGGMILLGFLFAGNLARAAPNVSLVYEELNINGTAYHGTIQTASPTDNVVFKVTVGGADVNQTVLVNLEIKSRSTVTHDRVEQKVWDNVFFAAGSTQSFEITLPKNLPAGRYGFSLGIFNPGWNGVLNWYGDQEVVEISSASGGATGGSADVVLSHNTLSPSVPAGQSNTITTFLKGVNGPKTVLLDLEIKDVNYEKMAQKFWNNLSFTAGETKSFTWDIPPTLPPGTYTVAIGIFNQDWNGLLHWYRGQETFVVTAGTPVADVVLVDSSKEANVVWTGSGNVLRADVKNTGSTGRRVLVDLEVYNEAGVKIAQAFEDNFYFAGGNTTQFNVVTPGLSPGTYTFKVGIFEPGWSSLIHWYNSAQTFTVVGP